MCMAYYLGTDGDAPLIPWEEDAPGFYTAEVLPGEEAVRKHFSVPRIVFFGSHEKCGCGFRCDAFGEPELEDATERQTRADHEALVRYVKDLLANAQTVQIYGCWSGDEAEPSGAERTCTLRDLKAPDFQFHERERLTVLR
jgi:hypothetical protein